MQNFAKAINNILLTAKISFIPIQPVTIYSLPPTHNKFLINLYSPIAGQNTLLYSNILYQSWARYLPIHI